MAQLERRVKPPEALMAQLEETIIKSSRMDSGSSAAAAMAIDSGDTAKSSAETETAKDSRDTDTVKSPAKMPIVIATPPSVSSSTPSWFTPTRLLVIFCWINLLNYVDRGTIASNGVNGFPRKSKFGGSGIQGDFNLSNFKDGVISSAFMVGLLLASPIFALLAKSLNPFRLIGVGLLVWTIAVTGCAMSFDFWSITICRMLVGVGEASFISLAAPFIDDNAPTAKKTSWLAVFYMCIPAGYAMGYVYGGLVGTHLGWRYAFGGEAILMLPFAILGFVIKPLQMKGIVSVDTEAQSEPSKTTFSSKIRSEISRFAEELKLLLSDKIYTVNVLGYIVYNFVMGAYSYWGPKAVKSIYHMTNADMIFGGITIVCGIFGTLAGGLILDFMRSTIQNAFKLLAATTFLGALFCFGAFWFKSMYAFIAFFAVGELLVFATQGPVNFVCLHSVTPEIRPLSMAISTVAIHIFGDVPSSPLVGLLQDHLNNWRKTAIIFTSFMFPAAIIWFLGLFLKKTDRIQEDTENSDGIDDKQQNCKL